MSLFFYRSSVKSITKSPKHEYAVVNFDIISSDFYDQLEVLDFLTEDSSIIQESTEAPTEGGRSEISPTNAMSPPQFKMPNLEDFETKTRTTPKANKYLSQSPVLVSKAKKKRSAILSSDEDDDFSILEPPKKGLYFMFRGYLLQA